MTRLSSSTWSASISLSHLLVPMSGQIVVDSEEPTTPFRRPARSMLAGRRVRGAAIRAFVLWYEGELGPPRFRSLLSRLPAGVASHFNLEVEGMGIDEDQWYAGSTVAALLDVLTAHLSEQRRGYVALRAARVVMRATLAGAYQEIFARVSTPAHYACSAQELWNAYYDSGVMSVVQRRDVAGAICTVRDWRAHHPLLCGLNGGASTAIYEAMGKQQVATLRVACVSRGQDECVFSTTWQE